MQFMRDIRAQPPAAGSEHLLDAWITDNQQAVEAVRATRRAVADGDQTEIRQAASQWADAYRKLNREARNRGLTGCTTSTAKPGSAV